jgi:hypothetical protein
MHEVKDIKWKMKESSLIDNYTHFHEEIMLLITQILSLLASNQNPGYPTRFNSHKNSRNSNMDGKISHYHDLKQAKNLTVKRIPEVNNDCLFLTEFLD